MPVDPTYEHLKAPTLTFNANQLILTVSREQTRPSGGKGQIYQWDVAGSRIREFREGRFAILTANDWEVQVAPLGTTTIFGIAQDVSNPKDAKITRPNLPPDIDTDTFTGKIEGVQIELLQWWIVREIPIALGGTTADVGDSVAPDSGVAHQWEGLGSQTGNGSITLVGAAAQADAIVAISSDGVFV